MHLYILRRLLGTIPILIGVSILIFFILRVMPGDVAAMILGGGEQTAGVNKADLDRLRSELELDKPILLQYWSWASRALQGDLGRSLWTTRPVAREIWNALPVTLELSVLALMFSLLMAIPLGVIAAARQDTGLDHGVRLFSIGGLSVPEFWTATMLLLIPLILFHWVPPLRYVPLTVNPASNLQQFAYPSIVLGVALSASVMRMTRSAMLEVLNQDYIRTAWAKGLRERVVLIRHALKNAMIPVITLIGLQVGRLLGGAVVVEQIFGLPGVGRLIIDGVLVRDYPIVQGTVLFFSLSFMLINLVVDVLYGWLDPRVKYA